MRRGFSGSFRLVLLHVTVLNTYPGSVNVEVMKLSDFFPCGNTKLVIRTLCCT